jgi:two-component system chemotaxis response regulator CheB
MLSDVLSSIPGVEVAGTSFDGEDCLVQLEKLRPDFVTLDINMPRRDGLSTLAEIRKRGIKTQVVMVSSPTAESAEQTLLALRSGALDMILKPAGSSIQENRRSLEEQLLNQVETVRGLLKSALRPSVAPTRSPALSQPGNNARGPMPTANRVGTFQCLCVGVSTGGPAALGTIIPLLPVGLPVPIFIVQHMPPVFTKSMANHLASISKVPVGEATHGEVAKPGHVYIAPGGKQMKLVRKGVVFEIVVNDDPALGACKPSVDYLLNSAAEVTGGSTLTLILTGMGSDGLAGCRKLGAMGAHVLAQSGETCVVYGMPRQIVDNGLANEIIPLNGIAARLVELLKGKR